VLLPPLRLEDPLEPPLSTGTASRGRIRVYPTPLITRPSPVSGTGGATGPPPTTEFP
jgi:hypothetical protein